MRWRRAPTGSSINRLKSTIWRIWSRKRRLPTIPRSCELIPTFDRLQRRKPAISAGIRCWVSGIPVAHPISMITKESVETVLGRVRPFLQADGGDIEVVNVDGNSIDVKLTGMCAGCPSAHMTLYLGVETALREELPEFESLRLV